MLTFGLSGPPAMKLITMVEVSNADEEDEDKIAKLLTVGPPPGEIHGADDDPDIVHNITYLGIHGGW